MEPLAGEGSGLPPGERASDEDSVTKESRAQRRKSTKSVAFTKTTIISENRFPTDLQYNINPKYIIVPLAFFVFLLKSAIGPLI